MPEWIALITDSWGGFRLLTAIELAKPGYGVGVAHRVDARALDVQNFWTSLPLSTPWRAITDGIDVLINNAGFALDIKLEELRRQFETNFLGTVAMTKAGFPRPIERSGHNIQMSSIGDSRGQLRLLATPPPYMC